MEPLKIGYNELEKARSSENTPYSKHDLVLSHLGHDPLFATPWTITHQVLLSMEFPRQEYWRGMPRPSLGDLPDPGIEPVSLKSLASAGGSFTTSAIGKYEKYLHFVWF